MNARINHGAFAAGRAALDSFRLEDQGYCIVCDCVGRSEIGKIAAELEDAFKDTPFCQGPFYGEQTKRFGRVLARSPSAASLVLHPLILGLAKRVLRPWCDTIQLNVAQGIEIQPGALAQYPHRDQDMWRGVGRFEYCLNVMWPLTRFTADNGATLIWPDSHGPGQDVSPQTSPIAAEAKPGDAIVFLGSTLHGAGANRTGTPRRAIVVGYSLGWLRAYENQTLAYPPEIARRFPADLAALVGYRQHRPNLGNFEGQCPSILLRDEEGQALGAIDALSPEQSVQLARYAEDQRAELLATSSAGYD